jgi:hypothetical protein
VAGLQHRDHDSRTTTSICLTFSFPCHFFLLNELPLTLLLLHRLPQPPPLPHLCHHHLCHHHLCHCHHLCHRRCRRRCCQNESVLEYWKRMAAFPEMRPLAMVARDVLGLASSSASVERLFSHAGFVLSKKRGSLSARLLAKQVMLRMWEVQGFVTAGDI